MRLALAILAPFVLLGPSSASEEAGAGLRVLTLNIWQEGTSVEGGFAKIVDVVRAADADLVGLTEVRNYEDRDFCARLVAALREDGAGYHAGFGGGDVGLLSRWPIASAELLYGEAEGDSGSIVAFEVSTEEEPLFLAVAHLDYRNYALYLPRGYGANSFQPLGSDDEPAPVTELAALHAADKASHRDEAHAAFLTFSETCHAPLILVGDFNEGSHLDWTKATQDSFGHNGVVVPWENSRNLAKAGFRDAWRTLYPDPVTHHGATWPSEAWGKKRTSWAPLVDERDRIDFVYVRGPLEPKAAWVVGSPRYDVLGSMRATETSCPFLLEDLPWPSDHKGVLVEFASPAETSD